MHTILQQFQFSNDKMWISNITVLVVYLSSLNLSLCSMWARQQMPSRLNGKRLWWRLRHITRLSRSSLGSSGSSSESSSKNCTTARGPAVSFASRYTHRHISHEHILQMFLLVEHAWINMTAFLVCRCWLSWSKICEAHAHSLSWSLFEFLQKKMVRVYFPGLDLLYSKVRLCILVYVLWFNCMANCLQTNIKSHFHMLFEHSRFSIPS